MSRRSLRLALLAAAVAAPLAVAACSIDLQGTLPADAGPADATVPKDAGDAQVLPDATIDDAADESLPDAAPLPEAGKDAGKDCGAVQGPTGQAQAFPSLGPKTIDGLLDDWGCEAPIFLTSVSAAYVMSDGGVVAVSARVRFEYEATTLYIAAEVTDPLLQGDGGDSTLNDSIEMYGAPDAGPLPGTYGPKDHHYVWDYKGLVQDWAKPTANPPPPNEVTSKVLITATGYVVEASFAPAAFARKSYLAGDAISLDLQLNDADGVRQNAVLVWTMATSMPCTCTEPACCCGSPGDLPFCDTRKFGQLVLR
jgi:hypothetical protein